MVTAPQEAFYACTHEPHGPSEHPAGYPAGRRGFVLTEVWEAGHRYVWTCRCKTVDHCGLAQQLRLF